MANSSIAFAAGEATSLSAFGKKHLLTWHGRRRGARTATSAWRQKGHVDGKDHDPASVPPHRADSPSLVRAPTPDNRSCAVSAHRTVGRIFIRRRRWLMNNQLLACRLRTDARSGTAVLRGWVLDDSLRCMAEGGGRRDRPPMARSPNGVQFVRELFRASPAKAGGEPRIHIYRSD